METKLSDRELAPLPAREGSGGREERGASYNVHFWAEMVARVSVVQGSASSCVSPTGSRQDLRRDSNANP